VCPVLSHFFDYKLQILYCGVLLLIFKHGYRNYTFTLVAPSRLYGYNNWEYDLDNHNEYCIPLRMLDSDVLFDVMDNDFFDRYHSINIEKWDEDDINGNSFNLIEIRMHHGTTEARKVIAWISLWMSIVNVSVYKWEGEGIEGNVFNDVDTQHISDKEDIFTLLEKEEIHITKRLKEILFYRRKEMRIHWRRALPSRVEQWEQAGWYEESTYDLD